MLYTHPMDVRITALPVAAAALYAELLARAQADAVGTLGPREAFVAKMIVAARRSPAAAKQAKNRAQAAAMPHVLAGDRPPDVRAAYEKAAGRGKAWHAALVEGARGLPDQAHPARPAGRGLSRRHRRSTPAVRDAELPVSQRERPSMSRGAQAYLPISVQERHAMPAVAFAPATCPITLALQGGGALGAFSWGVLDRLLDEPRLAIRVASGASAGAMNAAMLVQGLASGGPDGGRAEARALLEKFWRRVAVAAGSPDLDAAAWLPPFGALFGPMTNALPGPALPPGHYVANALRGVLDGLFDPETLGRQGAPSLVVAATKLSTGEPRLFRDGEITTEVLVASACLPQLMPPVELDGELFWDGGFASNPPLRPLIEAGSPPDVILVRTSPAERPEPPRGTDAIHARSAELTFGAALRQELRSLAVARRLIAELPDPPPPDSALDRLRKARLHAIGAEEAFRALPSGSGLAPPRWDFLRRMRSLGHQAADRWLAENLSAIGTRPTLDLAPFAAPLVALPDPGPTGSTKGRARLRRLLRLRR